MRGDIKMTETDVYVTEQPYSLPMSLVLTCHVQSVG